MSFVLLGRFLLCHLVFSIILCRLLFSIIFFLFSHRSNWSGTDGFDNLNTWVSDNNGTEFGQQMLSDKLPVYFLIPDAIWFKFGPFLKNSARV